MEAKCGYSPELTGNLSGCGSLEEESLNAHSIESGPGERTFFSGKEFEEFLRERSREHPVLIIFLRQLGCTFAREAVDQLKAERATLEKLGVEPILIHMSTWESAQERFSALGLAEVKHYSDRAKKAYTAFELGRASLGMILHPVAVARAIWLSLSRGYKVSYAGGDCFQMPGVLILKDGNVIHKVTPKHVGEKISYHSLLSSLDAPLGTPELSHRNG